MNPWRFLPFKRLRAFENMAIDEAIFRENQRRDTPPTLRFYGWINPAVSIGYFQNLSKEVDLDTCRKNHYDVVRRPTGGKAVFHDHDLTYAVIAKTKYPPFTDDILGTYQVISRCLVKGLEKIKIHAQMAEEKRAAGNESIDAFCFSVPSLHELLVQGKKICGSAQVRSHGSFLQHGSLLIGFDPAKTRDALLPHLDRDKQIGHLLKSATSVMDQTQDEIDSPTLCRVLKEGIEETLGICCIEGSLTAGEEALKDRLLKKYQDFQWTAAGRHQDAGNRGGIGTNSLTF